MHKVDFKIVKVNCMLSVSTQSKVGSVQHVHRSLLQVLPCTTYLHDGTAAPVLCEANQADNGLQLDLDDRHKQRAHEAKDPQRLVQQSLRILQGRVSSICIYHAEGSMCG
jgi:hypothetical protein